MENERVKVNAEVLLQLNRNTADGWITNDIVLGEGEPALLLNADNKTPIGIKYGDGTRKFSELELIPLGVDGEYMPESENAQSGKAVAEAIANAVFDASGIAIDQAYNAESPNAQSGKAVAEAIANIEISGGGSGLTVVSTLQELKTAIANNSSPIMFNEGVEITLGETIYVPENTVIIGNNAKIKRANGFDGKLLNLKEDCKVSNLKIDGNRENTVSPYWDKTIEISTLARCVIENVVIENGNEAIICYGDDVIVRHCQISNCGNSAIHFSGANRTRVENCTVIGTNKKSGMGHDEGAIIWSNSCDYVTCTENYIEDAKSAFGAIDQNKNSHLKIIGNTAKNCLMAVFSEWTGLSDDTVPSNIFISNNHFISCDIGYENNKKGIYILNANPAQNRKAENIIISNNILEDTSINVCGAKDLNITDNVITDGQIQVQYSPETICANNKVDVKSVSGIYFSASKKSKIVNNIVRGATYVIYLSGSSFSIVSGNHCSQHIGTNNQDIIKINSSPCLTIENNQLFIYSGQGFAAGNGDIVTNNRFDCANADIISIRIWGGTTGAIAEKNLTNGKFAISAPTDGFAGNNYGLPITEFLDVTFTLTNVTSNGIAKVLNGDDYTCTLTATEGYSLPETITVTIGETATTNFTYNASTGEVVIPNVTGVVTITAEGV